MTERIPGSFRDPSGYVYERDGKILRTVASDYIDEWKRCLETGFLEQGVASGRIVPFRSVDDEIPGGAAVLEVERIPFITYPYEWCFGQLKDAALLSLDLQIDALARGLTLKDASAYNVQFIGSHPVFIDLLSFESREENQPWSAYRQFCMHFLAPLALIRKTDLRCGTFSRLWIDGVPLELAVKMLPWRSRFSLGLYLHLYLHARLEAKHGDARKSADKARKAATSTKTQIGIAENLRSTINSLRLPATRTVWGDYYQDTNYDDEAAALKYELVAKAAKDAPGRFALDLGANTGKFSAILSESHDYVLAADIDPLAVERHYGKLKTEKAKNILPLILDFANPSPGIGWACSERAAFADRCRVDFITALAVIHHMVITAGIPMDYFAAGLKRLLAPGGRLLLEFVPKEDSQVRRMLAARKDVFDNYSVEGMRVAFSPHFREMAVYPIAGTVRTLHLFNVL